ncbi:MAG: DUF2484 family protein [Pseudomonadota bacterium]
MSLSVTLACLWVVVASVIAMFPSKRHHWPAAYVLITIGLPILGFVVYEHGIWIGLVASLAGISILRWPVRYLWRWTKRQVGLGNKA